MLHGQARVHEFAPGERLGLAGIQVRQRPNVAAGVVRDEDVGLTALTALTALAASIRGREPTK